MSYIYDTNHIVNEINQMKIILEGFEKCMNEKPKLDSFDAQTLTKIFQSLSNTITNTVTELKNSESRYREMYETSPVLYVTLSLDGNITNCNMKFADRLGCTRKELLGSSLFDCVDKTCIKKIKEIFQMWKKRGHISNEEVWIKTKFGTTFPVLLNASNLYDGHGKVIGCNSVLQEITDVHLAKKTSEEKIRLDAKIKELEKSDKLRQELLSVVKHEFRTPLVPIKGYCEMLLDQSHENLTDDQKIALNGIFQGIEKFDGIVDKMLDIHALETDNVVFSNEVILVQDFMTGVASNFSKRLTQKIEFSNPTYTSLKIKGDVDKILDVFQHLLDNALSFIPKENGKIEIGTKENDHKIVFYLKNNGPEIQKQEQENIFKKFYQIDTSHTRRHQGMGLGLCICKEIIKKLNGNIWCESELGKGVIFYFSLPVYNEETLVETT